MADNSDTPYRISVVIAMARSYFCGTWSAEHVAPIKLKKHGRPEYSVFARGFMLPGDLLHAEDLREVSLVAFGLLRAAGAALKKVVYRDKEPTIRMVTGLIVATSKRIELSIMSTV